MLRPGGLLIAETVNPEPVQSFKAFWIDPTHETLLYPDVLLTLCRLAGFDAGRVLFPGGTGDRSRDRRTQPAYAVVVETRALRGRSSHPYHRAMTKSGDGKDTLERYTRAHPHFRVSRSRRCSNAAVRAGPSDVIADLGCGDGWLVWALLDRELAGNVIYAVDLSPERVRRAASIDDRVRGIVADATRVENLPDASVDGIIVSQVIEHLPDDRDLAPEIARLLRPGGWWYVGSILRGPRAWWIYRKSDGWRLDPTHEREYGSSTEFAAVLEHPQLEFDRAREYATRQISDC